MSDPRPTDAPSATDQMRAFQAFLSILVLIVIAATITLRTVHDPGTLEIESSDPTPLGYTWSLVLFVLPLLGVAAWFLRHPDYGFQKRAFWTTLIVLVPLGAGLDLLFGHKFFTFPNPGAILGIEIPAVGGGIPIEEFIFYITGFLFVLLLYIWADEYWVAAYNVPDYGAALGDRKLLGFHWQSVALGLALIVLAAVYKQFFTEDPEGFPWYFTYLVAASIIPSAGFFQSTRRFINWRAFATTFYIVLLISLLWEATLASPYGWWRYQSDAMIGIFIGAWRELPVEAVLVWLAVTFTTVILYEVVKLWQASGKGLKDAMLG